MVTDEYIQKQIDKAEVLGLEHYVIGEKDRNSYGYLIVHNTPKGKLGKLYIPSGVEHITSKNTYDDSRNIREIIGSDTKLDINRFDTFKVIGGSDLKDLECFFAYTSCNIIDIDELDTSNIGFMDHMFYCCDSTVIGIDKLKTSKVLSMRYMFCEFGKKNDIINLSNFDISNVNERGMQGMFDCIKCKIKGINKFPVTIFKQ